MSTTTQILFNSPALHSLKRDQLVKLCKIHSIKANGKNVELVERLKTHARNLPRDSPLSVAFRSEEAQDEEEIQEAARPRPSSQWEIVMDSIVEEAEESSSQGTLSSRATLTGEFGTGSSKSTTTVSSSIRALASSFGLKRHATNSSSTLSSKASSNKLLSSFPLPPPSTDELRSNSTPYDALPPPSLADLQTDHFTFDTTDPAVVAANLNPTLGTAPLPGHTLRPGVPAPVNARLSLGLAPRTPSKQGPTTTIRLVSFGNATSTNAKTSTATMFPPPGDTPKLKPFETTFDLDLGSPVASASPPMDDTARRISLEASGNVADEDEDVPMPGGFSTPPPLAQPKFVFGSPSPQPAPFSFTATTPLSPEAEAAKKARLAAEVMEEMNRRVFGEGTPPPAARVIRPLGSAKKSLGSTKGQSKPGRFDKAHEQVFGRMESIADLAARRQELKRKSSVASVRVGFAGGEEQRGKRVKVEGGAGVAADKSEVDARKQEERTQAEKEAIRRKLEASRARRRSSAAAGGARRTSGRVSGVLIKPKPKPGRFGFFAGAAKLVQGVWGKKATPAVPKPAPAPAPAATKQPKSAPAKPATRLGKMGPPSLIPVPPIPTTANANANANTRNLRAPSVKSMASTRSSTAAGRSRSPIPPSFAGTASSKATTSSTASSSVRTRNSSIAGASSVGTRTSSLAAGSMGTRTSSLRVGSMGTRSSSLATTPSSTVDSARKRPSSSSTASSSRLLAPTASSLAKMSASPSGGSLAAVQEKERTDTDEGAAPLDAITNAPAPAPGPSVRGKKGLAPPRKPRISRSRVIAKLASQRVASGSSIASASSAGSSVARKSLGAARVRSSLGAKVQRGSLGGIKNRGLAMGGAGVLDAKKRARQSEYYARRKSRVGLGLGVPEEAEGGESDAMNVDS
ncbi:hypothetical protein C8R46DRAFT_987838 [Mycena filopes]|nr:hypothetical protein C8R46DRAFT_987838 [Mycena filopes]